MKRIELDLLYRETEPIRLDSYLTEIYPELSRSQIRLEIEKQSVTVNDQPAKKAGQALRTGDRVGGFLTSDSPLPSNPEAEDIALEIVHDDPVFAVIDKPAGLSVHPSSSEPRGTLVNALLGHYKSSELSDLNADPLRPGIVHRLDKDTSGLLVIAKTSEAHRNLSEQLAKRDLKRVYLACVYGRLKEVGGRIEAALARNPKDRLKMAVSSSPQARQAITYWQLLAQLDKFALLRVELDTGRTHQIRVHFASLGRPLIGDKLYGNKATMSRYIARQALHAYQLRFQHPLTGEPLRFQARPPADILKLLSEAGYDCTDL